MGSLLGGAGGGHGGLWWRPFESQKRQGRRRRSSKPSDSVDRTTSGGGYRFPLKQALTAGSLAFAGDSIAQLSERYRKRNSLSDSGFSKDIMRMLCSNHDWLRALRMASYGFLLYGPGSYAWYQYLDHALPKQTVENLLLKVLLNQIVLGPSVVAIVFAWNNIWQGKLSELPNKYQKDAIPTLITGYKFWIPVSVLNFCFWNVDRWAGTPFFSVHEEAMTTGRRIPVSLKLLEKLLAELTNDRGSSEQLAFPVGAR